MKKLILIVSISIICNSLFACCGAGKYRIFPLGSSNGKPVIAVFDLTRTCDRGEMFKKYHWRGMASLYYYDVQGDSLVEFYKLDKLEFYQTNNRDTVINDLEQFYDSISLYYQKLVNQAKKLPNFKPAKLKEYVYREDSAKFENIRIIEDTILMYGASDIDLSSINSLAAGYYESVNEMRTFDIEGKEFAIVSVSTTKGKFMSKSIQEFNTNNFKNIETAYTVLQLFWHDSNTDVLLYN